MSETKAAHIVLTGAMGTGKTTIGRRLARRLQMPFIDSDEQLETKLGMSGRAYAEAHGVPALHRAETEMLLQALAHFRPSVIAAAASIADSDVALTALVKADPTLFVLDAPIDVLAARIGVATHRRDISISYLEASTHRRHRALEDLQPANVIDTGRLTIEEAVDRMFSTCADRARGDLT